MESHQLFDQVADNGDVLTRGYLELVLDEQHCEGASPEAEDGTPNLTLTLIVKDSQQTARESFVFATRVRHDEATPEIKKRLLLKFMDRLTNKHSVSTFLQPGEIDKAQLKSFADEMEYATVSWVD
jgi:hypothetical protein